MIRVIYFTIIIFGLVCSCILNVSCLVAYRSSRFHFTFTSLTSALSTRIRNLELTNF